MPTTPSTPAAAVAGLWTVDVAIAWLKTLEVPHDPGVALHRGPKFPRNVDRVCLVTPTTGPAGGDGYEEADASWKGFQLLWRSRQRQQSDRDAERLSIVAHRRIMRAHAPAWLPTPGGGRVRLLERVRTAGGGPAPIGSGTTPDERALWACTYLLYVIEGTS